MTIFDPLQVQVQVQKQTTYYNSSCQTQSDSGDLLSFFRQETISHHSLPPRRQGHRSSYQSPHRSNRVSFRPPHRSTLVPLFSSKPHEIPAWIKPDSPVGRPELRGLRRAFARSNISRDVGLHHASDEFTRSQLSSGEV